MSLIQHTRHSDTWRRARKKKLKNNYLISMKLLQWIYMIKMKVKRKNALTDGHNSPIVRVRVAETDCCVESLRRQPAARRGWVAGNRPPGQCCRRHDNCGRAPSPTHAHRLLQPDAWPGGGHGKFSAAKRATATVLGDDSGRQVHGGIAIRLYNFIFVIISSA